MKKSNKLFGKIVYVPSWWVFDSLNGTLFAEGREISKYLFLGNRIKQHVHKQQYFVTKCCQLIPIGKSKLLAIPINGGVSFLLYEDREITLRSADETISNYELRCTKANFVDDDFKADLYIALHSFNHYRNWDRDKELRSLTGIKDEDSPRVQIIGKNRDGERITDHIRVIIPLTNNDGVAISEKGTKYYLLGNPTDSQIVLSNYIEGHTTSNVIRFRQANPAAYR